MWCLIVRSLAVLFALFASVAGLVGWPSVISAQPPSEHAILVLHTYGQGSPFRWAFDRALQQTLQQRGFAAADLYVEALESNRFPGDNHAALFRQYLAATRGEVDEALAGLFAELVEECAP